MEELQNICTYQEFKAATDREVLNQAEGFVRLGYLLRKAKDTEILRASRYTSVVEFAQEEYGLTETYVSRYMAINKRYSKNGYSPYLNERFQGYGMAKLAEMLTLSDEVVDALPPQMTRTEIQEVKREIRDEQAVTDLEVMMEEAEAGDAGESILEQWLHVYVRENKEDWDRTKAMHPEISGPEWVMEFLAPSGIGVKMARIKGCGKFMLAIKGKDRPLELINLRTNEKEEYSLTECAKILEEIGQRQAAEKAAGEKIAPVQETETRAESGDREKTEEAFVDASAGAAESEKSGDRAQKADAEKVPPNTAAKEKIAPVQEYREQEQNSKKGPAPAAQHPAQHSDYSPDHAKESSQDIRQMDVEDYPQILPDGYVSSASYIQCHDGSEVMEKEWNEAEELIGALYQMVSENGWDLEVVYQGAVELMAVLEKLRKSAQISEENKPAGERKDRLYGSKNGKSGKGGRKGTAPV